MNKQHKTNSVESPLQHIETANKFLPRFFSGQAETMALNIPFFPIAGIDGDFSKQVLMAISPISLICFFREGGPLRIFSTNE